MACPTVGARTQRKVATLTAAERSRRPGATQTTAGMSPTTSAGNSRTTDDQVLTRACSNPTTAACSSPRTTDCSSRGRTPTRPRGRPRPSARNPSAPPPDDEEPPPDVEDPDDRDDRQRASRRATGSHCLPTTHRWTGACRHPRRGVATHHPCRHPGSHRCRPTDWSHLTNPANPRSHWKNCEGIPHRIACRSLTIPLDRVSLPRSAPLLPHFTGAQRTPIAPPRTRHGCRSRLLASAKAKRAAPMGRPFLKECPAASYSPTRSPLQYHRR